MRFGKDSFVISHAITGQWRTFAELLLNGHRIEAVRVLRPLIESKQITGDMAKKMWDTGLLWPCNRTDDLTEGLLLKKGLKTKPVNEITHHDLPFQTGGSHASIPNLQLEFLKRGIDCNDATIGGRFVPKDFHDNVLHFQKAGLPRGIWNYQWEMFFQKMPDATGTDIEAFLKKLVNATDFEKNPALLSATAYDIKWPYPIP